jgi:3,4-dihydroxy 2-butanone 4-phosphate synthase/GTP cyclohydrolase II
VRVHVHDLVTDLFGRKRGVGWESPLKNSLYRLAKEKNAVLVLLTPESKDKPIEKSSPARKCGTPDVQIRDTVDIRTFGIGAQILRDLGVKNMRVLGEPKVMHAISGFGLNIVDYVPQY